MKVILLSLCSYLLGSIPFGVLIAKIRGINLRRVGSGNIGATNVLRSIGKSAAIITLFGDMLKGITAVVIGRYFIGGEFYELLFGIIAVLGHNFSIFLKFKGGKGVATGLGVLLICTPKVALISILVWFLMAIISRYSSLSAIIAFFTLPLNIFIVDYSEKKFLFGIILAILILYSHRDNIKRLMKGSEKKIGEST